MQHTPEDLNEKMLRHAIQGSPRLAGFLTDRPLKTDTLQVETQGITAQGGLPRPDTTKSGTVIREAFGELAVEESESKVRLLEQGAHTSTTTEDTPSASRPPSIASQPSNSPPLMTSGIYPSHLVSALDLEFAKPGYMPPHAPEDSAESVDASLPAEVTPPAPLQNSISPIEADVAPNTVDEISQVQLKSAPKESGIAAPQMSDQTEPELSETTCRPIPLQESQSAHLPSPASQPPVKTTFSPAPENAAPGVTRNGFPRDKHIPEKSNLIWGIAALGALLVLFATILFTWPTISQHMGSSALSAPPTDRDQPRVGFNTTSPPTTLAPDSPPTNTAQAAPAGMTPISSVQPTPDTDTPKAGQPESTSPANTAAPTLPTPVGAKK